MKQYFFHLSLTTKLFCLVILLATVNCDCGNQMVDDDNKDKGPVPNQRIQGSQIQETLPTDHHEPKLQITGEKEVIDDERIPFTVSNQDDQLLELEGMKAIITLHETRGFDDQEIQEGEIIVYNNKKEELGQSREITLKLANLLEVNQLVPNEKREIEFLALVGIDNLASAKVTFQIKDTQDKLLANTTTAWKLTNKIGPFPGKNNQIGHTLDFTRLALKQGELNLPIKFKNLIDHPIDLKKADYRIIITDQASGQEILNETCPGENVRMQRAIIPKGQDLELLLNIPQIKNKNFAEDLLKNNLKCRFTSLSKASKEEIGDYNETLDLKVGPIHGQSKVNIEILENIKTSYEKQGNTYAGFQAKITNQSDHPINPKLAVYRYQLTLKDGTILAKGSVKGDLLLIDEKNNMIPAHSQGKNKQQEPSYTLPFIDFTLTGYTRQQYLNYLNAQEITFELEMLTLDEGYGLGKNS